jgi:isoleucyl-tRNA synthetase
MNQEELMDSILKFWKENDSFQRSISERSEKLNYNFYDGPPFAS